MNIQTHFQLEEHIVFRLMIDLPIYRFHKMKTIYRKSSVGEWRSLSVKYETKIRAQKYERKMWKPFDGNHLMDHLMDRVFDHLMESSAGNGAVFNHLMESSAGNGAVFL